MDGGIKTQEAHIIIIYIVSCQVKLQYLSIGGDVKKGTLNSILKQAGLK